MSAASPYEDPKGRFTLQMEDGWALRPQFGDTSGMTFARPLRGRRGEGVALFWVRVEPGTAFLSFVEAVEAALAAQPGFTRLGEQNQTVAGVPGLVREYRAQVAKTRYEKRMVAYYAAVDGRMVLLHAEGPERDFERIRGEVAQMVASFRLTGPTRAASRPARLTGRWKADSGLVLALGDDGSFALAEVSGRYEIESDSLTLVLPAGRETFSYILADDILTLSSNNLEEPIVYRRQSGSKPAPKAQVLTDTALLGRWANKKAGVELALAGNHQFELGEFRGRWVLLGDKLQLERSKTEVITYQMALQGDRLTLSGGDLDDPLRLRRQ